jgi:hypothetical protein
VTTLIIVLAIAAALYLWSAMATCALAGFTPGAIVVSQLSGPGAYADFTGNLLALPGVRQLERTDDEVLVSVMPVPSSMERGFGLFAVARRQGDEVVLLGRGKLPMAPGLDGALRQLERDVRMRASYGRRY